MHYPGGNATDPIWRVLASSLGISSWTPLQPQHSNLSPNPLANQLWCIDFLTPPTPLIIPHRLPAFLESLMPLKNWCSIHARCSKSCLKHSIRFCGIFSKFTAYHSSKVSSRPDCIFEILQLWQSGFSRVYSNCCCSCLFEPEIIKIGQSSHKMYSNNIMNFQESDNFKCLYQKSLETYWMHHILFQDIEKNSECQCWKYFCINRRRMILFGKIKETCLKLLKKTKQRGTHSVMVSIVWKWNQQSDFKSWERLFVVHFMLMSQRKVRI